jgi:hypothetical protein
MPMLIVKSIINAVQIGNNKIFHEGKPSKPITATNRIISEINKSSVVERTEASGIKMRGKYTLVTSSLCWMKQLALRLIAVLTKLQNENPENANSQYGTFSRKS